MPKFHKQNKKRTNPRYFLHESVEREDIIDDIREFSKDVTGSRDTYGDIDKLAIMDVPELEEYFKSLINAFFFCSKTLATMSGLSAYDCPFSNCCLISFQFPFAVIVIKNCGFPYLLTIAIASW